MDVFGGCFLSFTVRREERRLATGRTCEPPTSDERNRAAMDSDPSGATLCGKVETGSPRAIRRPALAADPGSDSD